MQEKQCPCRGMLPLRVKGKLLMRCLQFGQKGFSNLQPAGIHQRENMIRTLVTNNIVRERIRIVIPIPSFILVIVIVIGYILPQIEGKPDCFMNFRIYPPDQAEQCNKNVLFKTVFHEISPVKETKKQEKQYPGREYFPCRLRCCG
ncbi:hypothetical protein HMPREF9080_02894 [Cardiobacterium valvarum F0432]|uniref:Uncharacterized protein n=1 Tax=Cardiobacterium valvarum F0432 TaxID=797473 RepID=G9ZJC5_9GAMM|nr:hypothetical protein HMPREF9080_02894 [Cardiobacterium valvarum F0432]